MKSRRLAIVSARDVDTSLTALLREGGWHGVACRIDLDPAGTPDLRECEAGLVCITTADAGSLARLRQAVASIDRPAWIAVVGRGLIDHDQVRDFVSVYCVDYQTLPLDRERFLGALGHAAGMSRLADRDHGTCAGVGGAFPIVGDSPAMQALRRTLSRIAAVDAPVLVTGESGTGKELVARAIHGMSRRRERPLVAINCASLPPSLIHAELFGFEKGAFTGAQQRTAGYFEAACGGCIFLDEVGDLHPETQALLLRFLDEPTVRRVGGREEIRIDARVIAATNVDLETAVRQQRFREDLYHRLNVLRITLPPLRERPEDIDALTSVMLERYAAEKQVKLRGFSKTAMLALRSHSWPGNVRELLNRVRSAIIMSEGRLITPADLRLGEAGESRPLPRLDAARLATERQVILAALQRTGWSASKSAALIGVSRATFYRLLSRHGLAVEDSGSFPTLMADLPPDPLDGHRPPGDGL